MEKKKRILYINQYFKHPKEPGVTRSYWISQELLNSGYEVFMLAHRNIRHDFVENNVPKIEKKIIDNINVIYVKNEYDNSMGVFQRIISFLKFMLYSSKFALSIKEIDLVIASSTPITVAIPALLRKWLKKTPFIFEVRDLWPEVPIQMGYLKNPLIISLLRWLEKTTYRNANHVVALSPGMQEGITRYIEKEKTSMIPNMAKVDKFWPRPKDESIFKEYSLSPKSFKIIHFGAMGAVNGLENFIEAAEKINERNIENIELILVGHGRMKKKYEKIKLEKNINNLKIFGRLPMKEISALVNICDVSYVGVSKHQILEINSANKFFDSLAAGKPIMVNFNGWLKDVLEKENCGLKVHETDSEDFLEKILFLKNNPKLTLNMGKNARKLAEEKYDKAILTRQFVKLIDKLI